jgi:hypothetical protein
MMIKIIIYVDVKEKVKKEKHNDLLIRTIPFESSGKISFIIYTHPDSGLGEIRPHGYLFSSAHVRIPVSSERGL